MITRMNAALKRMQQLARDGCRIMDEDKVDALLPRRDRNAHKGNFGRVLILAGSVGYTGAPCLAAEAALRTGAGLIFVGVPEAVYPIVAQKLDEPMVFPLPCDEAGRLNTRAVPEIVRRLEKTLLFHGYLGLHLFALVWELRRNQHIPLNFAVRPFHAQQLCETAPAGIILYRSGRWNHFAAFRREEDGKLRFFGAVPGQDAAPVSMAEFYWDHVKFPLALTITVK